MEGSTKRARRLLAVMASTLGLSLGLTLVLSGGVGAGSGHYAANLRLDEPVTISSAAADAGGLVNAVIRLEDAPLAVAMGTNWKQNGGTMTPAEQQAYSARLESQQAALLPKVEALGGTKLAGVTNVLNALIVSIDSTRLDELAGLANVASVREIENYRLDLTETVPHIGAAAVQGTGVDGDGVVVGVIDSGIDYTHVAFGGDGAAASYNAAYGANTNHADNRERDGLFPTAKVIEGWDFVGETWPFDGPDEGTQADPPTPDEDPIDCGGKPNTNTGGGQPSTCTGGHGTHVSDIIAGERREAPNPNGPGVAPDASIVALKACSAVSTSCSGVALINAMNRALDPNNDGNLSDAVDVINMSLGSSYGQREDDLSFASTNATNAGIVVVASAGNSSDRPYIAGSPSSTPEVISVAQTHVPSAKLIALDTATADAGVVYQPWSGPTANVTGTLEYDTTNANTRIGCTPTTSLTPAANPFAAGSHAGDILLMDRGSCSVSHKVHNAFQAGAVAAVIANNVSAGSGPYEQPPTFSFGGGSDANKIAGYTVTLFDGNALKASALNGAATINPASAASLVNHIVQSSSRGPNHSYNAIKPDIGAPGASLSAEVGTGTGNTAFGGTSGAAPMVSGSVALLLDKYNHGRTPSEIKSLLMNTAETNVGLNPVSTPGLLAPITRIGGGEVRVGNAANSNTAAWDDDAATGSLSFGFHTVSKRETIEKTVRVRNYSGSSQTYSISNTFRYANDADSGAVTLSHPSRIRVPANSSRTFDLKLRINGSRLPAWTLDGGPNGGEGHLLQSVEFDGYLNIVGGGDNVHVAWQVLPRRSADVEAEDSTVRVGRRIELENDSKIQDGEVEVFSLLGTSPQLAGPAPAPGSERAVIDIRSVGARYVDTNGAAAGGEVVEFGINTYGARSHPNYPAQFRILLNTDADAADEYLIFNQETGGFGATGQNVVAIQNLAPAPCPFLPAPVPPATPQPCPALAFFFTDADLDTGNVIMTVPIQANGLSVPANTQMTADVVARDNYFSGANTDTVVDMTFTPSTPKYAVNAGPFSAVTVPAHDDVEREVSAVPGGDTASPSQTGFLFLERLGMQPDESETVVVTTGGGGDGDDDDDEDDDEDDDD
jgi:subtilisin family serine protease